ncbi:D-sedoheptulose-7-phosphate isomerase [Actinocorallia libanotica]|uniref:D-sedoheptulose-7-phosphate isomerase n=1 Tax=Actinocorallia libanotica TaxID=46162 RepID=UPI003CD05B00
MDDHLTRLETALARVRGQSPLLLRWGRLLAATLQDGGRLLACGNGGSAAQAQHLTAELVGRYQGERRPFSALSLHADTSAVTAIVNDYGAEELYARQVRAHGRPGDVLLALSTSGTSRNIVCAAHTAARAGMRTWALTGPAPNPLAAACEEALVVDAPSTATVQEAHLAIVHLLCEVVDEQVRRPAHRTVVRA